MCLIVRLVVIFTLCYEAVAEAQSSNTLTEEETSAGWTLLFDGTAAPGLRGVQKQEPLKSGWQIKGGELVLSKDLNEMGKVTGGDLMTRETFLDFEFSFEWKLSVSANTGIRYLVRKGVDDAAVGCEYQIIDDVHHPEGLKGGPLRRTGALDGIIAPSAGKRLNDPDQWNRGRIVVLGNHVEHWLNGQKVVEFDLGSRALISSAQAARFKVPVGFGTKFRSAIVILDQGDEFALRNLKVRPLPPADQPVLLRDVPPAESSIVAPSFSKDAPAGPLPPTPPDLK